MRAFELSGAAAGGIPTIGGKERSAARMPKRGSAALSLLRQNELVSTNNLQDAILQKIYAYLNESNLYFIA